MESERASGFNHALRLLMFLLMALFAALFVLGCMYKLDHDISFLEPFASKKLARYGFDNGLPVALFFLAELIFLIRCKSLTALVTQKGASRALELSISLFVIWIFNLSLHIFAGYGNKQVFILIMALLTYAMSLGLKQISFKFDMFANADGGDRRLGDSSPAGFMSFIESLLKR